MLKIIFIGDIVGAIGRAAVKIIVPKLRRKLKPDLVIANAENIAHGVGVTASTLQEVLDAGVDYCTSGNHVFARPGNDQLLNNDAKWRLLRPANYPAGADGIGEKVINISPPRLGVGEAGQKNILLVNLMGRVFMDASLDCPFRAFDHIIEKYADKKIDATIVDFHAEATSEKTAFKLYADGRATAILGTHTHIVTADEHITAKGTAYISDVGMVGAFDSVIGVKPEAAVSNFLNAADGQPLEPVETGACLFNAVLDAIDTNNKKTTGIKRIRKIVKIN